MILGFLRKRDEQELDVLEAKKKELEMFSSQYDSAISLVTTTVDTLSTLSDIIAVKIRDIEDYQSELNATKDGLCEMKAKNDKVAANFRALLGE